MNISYLTQLDYIKTLIEENRIGESLSILNELDKQIYLQCMNLFNKINEEDLILLKSDLTIKPNNYIYIFDNWIKLLSINKTHVLLEITKDLIIEKKYIIYDKKPKLLSIK